MNKKSKNSNWETVREAKAGREADGEIKLKHLPGQDGEYTNIKLNEVERDGKGLNDDSTFTGKGTMHGSKHPWSGGEL